MVFSKLGLSLGICGLALLVPHTTVGFVAVPGVAHRRFLGQVRPALVSFADTEGSAASASEATEVLDTTAIPEVPPSDDMPMDNADGAAAPADDTTEVADPSAIPTASAPDAMATAVMDDASEEATSTEDVATEEPAAAVSSFDPNEKRPMSQMEEGAVYPGQVKRIMDYGAFVNIGAERDVLVHISEFSTNYVYDVHDYVEEGQELNLRLISVDLDARRMQGSFILDDSLRSNKTRRRPERKQRERKDVSPFVDVQPDEVLDGVVVKCVGKGAFVQVASVSEAVDGWLPNSQIDVEEYVEFSADFLSEGQEIQVRVLDCNVEEGKLTFSQKI